MPIDVLVMYLSAYSRWPNSPEVLEAMIVAERVRVQQDEMLIQIGGGPCPRSRQALYQLLHHNIYLEFECCEVKGGWVRPSRRKQVVEKVEGKRAGLASR